MSSTRFPGKVLAPFRGRPMIDSVLESVRIALPDVPRTVITSTDATDDPLAIYLTATGTDVFRGPLEDVFERFCACLDVRPATWIMRICADSPLASHGILQALASHARTAAADLLTTTCPRSLPRGQNAEAIRAEVLRGHRHAALSQGEREHVTRFFYQHPEICRVLNLGRETAELSQLSLAVDEIADLDRIDDILKTHPNLRDYGPLRLTSPA